MNCLSTHSYPLYILMNVGRMWFDSSMSEREPRKKIQPHNAFGVWISHFGLLISASTFIIIQALGCRFIFLFCDKENLFFSQNWEVFISNIPNELRLMINTQFVLNVVMCWWRYAETMLADMCVALDRQLCRKPHNQIIIWALDSERLSSLE